MFFKKTIKYCYTLFLIVLTSNMYGQVDTAWTKTFGGEGINLSVGAVSTEDGGIVVASNSYPNGAEPYIVLDKLNSDGNLLWSKNYNTGNGDVACSIGNSSDGGFLILGNSGTNAKIIKTDMFGDTLWTKMYSDLIDTNISYIESNNSTGQGLLVLEGFGWLVSGKVIDSNENEFIWTTILDSAGISFNYNYFTPPFSVGDEPILMNFRTSDFLVLLEEINYSRIARIELDFSGEKLNENIYGSQYGDSINVNSIAWEAVNSANANIITLGTKVGSIWLTEWDWEGKIIWEKQFRSSYAMHRGNSFLRTEDEGFMIVGERSATWGADIVVIKTNSAGEEEWNQIYENGAAKHISKTTDNGFVISGQKNNKLLVTKLVGTPTAVIEADTVWLDEDWNGTATKTIDGINSFSSFGSGIIEYEWKINNEIGGSQSSVDLSLPIGSNNIKLTVKDDLGLIGSSEKVIQVCSYKLETEGAITSSISAIDDSVFFASSFDDKVYCFNDKNNLKWNLSIGGAIQSTTTIGPNKNIYVGSGDTRLYCFDPNGNFKWDTPMGGVVSASPAITQERTVYVGTENNRLYSVNGDYGSINWNFLTGGPITSSASLSKTGDIYFGSSDKKFYSLNSLGTVNWSYTTDGEIHSSPAIDTVGTVYLGSDDKKLYAINPDGTLGWEFATNGAIKSSPVIDAEGNIYFGSSDGNFYCVSASGSEIWKYNTTVPVNGDPSLTDEGNVIFGCENGNIISLTANGELNWSYKTDSEVKAAPLITSAGRIYVGSTDKSIYGFMDPNHKLEKRNSISHQWPTFQKDNKRTGSQTDIKTDIKNIYEKGIPTEFSLSQNYPNPFNPTTKIEFQLTDASFVELTIYSVTGEQVKTLVNSEQTAGYYTAVWNGLNDNSEKVGSGFYIYQIKANGKFGSFTQSRKMIKMK